MREREEYLEKLQEFFCKGLMKLYTEREEGEVSNLESAFSWSHTPEGQNFWSTMNRLFNEYKRPKAVDILVDYMWRKAEAVSKATNLPQNLCFTYTDERSMRNAKGVDWEEVLAKLLKHPDSFGYCPFCVVYEIIDCKGCPYGKAHGNCLIPGSSFNIIIQVLGERDAYAQIAQQVLNEIREEYDV